MTRHPAPRGGRTTLRGETSIGNVPFPHVGTTAWPVGWGPFWAFGGGRPALSGIASPRAGSYPVELCPRRWQRDDLGRPPRGCRWGRRRGLRRSPGTHSEGHRQGDSVGPLSLSEAATPQPTHTVLAKRSPASECPGCARPKSPSPNHLKARVDQGRSRVDTPYAFGYPLWLYSRQHYSICGHENVHAKSRRNHA